MRTKFYTFSVVTTGLLGLFCLTTAFHNGTSHDSILNGNGTSSSTGAPGESHTCSQSGCHGSGNGNSSTGGLVDNAGPGSITITSVPAMIGNTYVPGTTYHMTITVAEQGKTVFGFDAEMLDNSGNTDLHINNTLGTLTITDPVRTRIGQSYGTGRATVTHKLNAGVANNSSSFTFDWTAPASGILNIYTSAVTGNNDNLASAADNTYTKSILQISPASPAGIEENLNTATIGIYPNPTSDYFNLAFTAKENQSYSVQLIGIDGNLVKEFGEVNPSGQLFHQLFDIKGIASGTYFVKVNSGSAVATKKIIIQ